MNYVDPGAGSAILQVVIGLLFGALLFVKIFLKKIRDHFKK